MFLGTVPATPHRSAVLHDCLSLLNCKSSSENEEEGVSRSLPIRHRKNQLLVHSFPGTCMHPPYQPRKANRKQNKKKKRYHSIKASSETKQEKKYKQNQDREINQSGISIGASGKRGGERKCAICREGGWRAEEKERKRAADSLLIVFGGQWHPSGTNAWAWAAVPSLPAG